MGKSIISLRSYSCVFGHVVGLAIPESWTEALGVTEGIYHFGAVYIGRFWYNDIDWYVIVNSKTYNI